MASTRAVTICDWLAEKDGFSVAAGSPPAIAVVPANNRARTDVYLSTFIEESHGNKSAGYYRTG
jgi:hypothetical protein